MSWKAAEHTSSNLTQKRGYLPPQNDEERLLLRHVEDLLRTCSRTGINRYTGFLNDREQILAQSVINRYPDIPYHFDGIWEDAERKILCLEPDAGNADIPLQCVKISWRDRTQNPQHKDFLGAILGLGLNRELTGDIRIPDDGSCCAYVAVTMNAAQILCDELGMVGRTAVSAEIITDTASVTSGGAREEKRATVTSLRMDGVLAAILPCSRKTASELIASGRVEVNHIPVTGAGSAVYCSDIITVRGFGRYNITDIPGTSKKGKYIISYFKY